MQFVIYDPVNGRILRAGYCPDPDVEYQAQAGEGLLVSSGNVLTQYVSFGSVVDRPAQENVIDKTSVAVDEVVTISNVAPGAVATVGGENETTITDGVLELTFDTPGTYLVKLTLFPWLDWEVNVTCE